MYLAVRHPAYTFDCSYITCPIFHVIVSVMTVAPRDLTEIS